MTDPASLPYRPNAGIMLLNRERQVFVGQRIDSTLQAWQMPQGGIDEGEEPYVAAVRELWEETGIPPKLVEFVAAAPEPMRYDLPDELIGKVWNGKWRGQTQWWFLCRFLGEDHHVDIATKHPEYRAWRWVEPADLPSLIVPFKRDIYTRLLTIFAEHLETPGK